MAGFEVTLYGRIWVTPKGRNAAEVREGPHVVLKKCLGCFSRKRSHKAVVRVRKVHGQVVRLLFHSRNHHQRFAEIHLRLARRMCLSGVKRSSG
jgi:hypothetical protein